MSKEAVKSAAKQIFEQFEIKPNVSTHTIMDALKEAYLQGCADGGHDSDLVKYAIEKLTDHSEEYCRGA